MKGRLRWAALAAALCLGLTVGYCASAAEPTPTTVRVDGTNGIDNISDYVEVTV